MHTLNTLDNNAPQNASQTVWQKLHLDVPLIVIVLMIAGVGLALLFSASNQDVSMVIRQSVRLLIGFGVMLTIAQLPPRFIYRWSPQLYGLGVLMLILVLWIGVSVKGANRWLDFPLLPRFQPSECLKLAVPMMLAWYVSKRNLPIEQKPTVGALVLLAIPVILIAKQPDLGTAILVGSAGMSVLFLAGLRFVYIVFALILSVPSGYLMWRFVMHDYQKQRVLTFLDPEREPLGTGWNIIQSKIAIGSGGTHGKGWLQGTQSHLDFLPESSTDFIVAVLAEEWGFVGMLGLLTLYLMLFVRGVQIASQAPDIYLKLLSGSLIFTIFVYLFVNVGMVTGLLPVVGVPLPLVSYGGTSMVTLLASLGILMSIHTHKKVFSN